MNSVFNVRFTVDQVKNQLEILNTQLFESNKKLKVIEDDIKENIKLTHLLEIITLYKFLEINKSNPIEIIAKCGEVFPPYIKVTNITWIFNDKILLEPGTTTDIIEKRKNLELDIPREFFIEINLDTQMSNYGTTYADLQDKYNEFKNIINKNFPTYQITFSDLPQRFSFEDVSKSINIKVKLTAPKEVAKGNKVTEINKVAQAALSNGLMVG